MSMSACVMDRLRSETWALEVVMRLFGWWGLDGTVKSRLRAGAVELRAGMSGLAFRMTGLMS